MSILSDRQIRNLCTTPSFVVTAMVPSSNPSCDVYYLPTKQEYLTYCTAKFLDNEILKSRMSDSGIKSYRTLNEEEIAAFVPMISPFEAGQVRTKADGGLVPEKIISYGTSSFGYDVRLADEFKIFSNINSLVIDPLNFDHRTYVDHKGEFCVIPPNSYILGRTIETFKIPRNVMVVCLGKSTYARVGAIVNVTPIEAGFEGNVVIEISNSTSLPLKVYANMGISQFLFFEASEECEVSYADRGGKYQNQVGVQVAKV